MGSARTIMLNATIASTSRNVFLNGEYLRRVPQWHADDSAWKASGILRMLEKNDLSPRSIGEVGCGTGEVLRQLQLKMAPGCVFSGYDIAPQAIDLSRTRENDRLHCRLGDIRKDPDARFDLLLVLDVLEHQENYFSFLRDVKPLAPFKIFHTVLDLSVKAVLKPNGLMELRRTSDDLHFFSRDTMLLCATKVTGSFIGFMRRARFTVLQESCNGSGNGRGPCVLHSTRISPFARWVVTACSCWRNEE